MSDLFDLSLHQDPQGALWRKSATVAQDLLTEDNSTSINEANPNGLHHNTFYFVMTLEQLEQRIANIRAANPGERILIWEKADGKYAFFPGKGETPKQCADRRIAEECSSSSD